MALTDKLPLTDPSDRQIPERLEEKIKRIVAGSFQRLIKDLEQGVANLRIEVNDLKKEVEDNTRLVRLMEPYVRDQIIRELKCQKEYEDEMHREAIYKNFFCGDMGLLYVFADILSGLSEMQRAGTPDHKEIERYYAKNFAPLGNNLTIVQGKLQKQAAEDASVPNYDEMSTEELLARRAQLESTLEQPLLYTRIWGAVHKTAEHICSDRFEQEISEAQPSAAFDMLAAKVRDLAYSLKSYGIEIVAHPSDTDASMFKETASPSIPSKPLVYRQSDGFVYSYGLINESKPFTFNIWIPT